MKPVLLFLFLFLALIICDCQADFAPGCSFANDQCIYKVELGHVKQCDQPGLTTQTPAAASCCNKVTDLVDDMKKQMDSLKQQVDGLQKGGTAPRPSSSTPSALLVELNQLKSELISIKKEKEKATKEIHDLQAALTKRTSALQLCQSALGIGDSVQPKDPIAGNGSAVFICTFDKDSCGFGISQDRDVDFGVKATPFNKRSWGPTVDHTMGVTTGKVLGVDAYNTAIKHRSDAVVSGSATSKIFPPASDYCIFFWYLMPGRAALDLTANLVINGGTGYPVFKKTGRQSDQWQMAKVSLDFEYTSRKFQLMFKVTTNANSYKSASYAASIAIDDVYVYDTKCSNVPRFSPGAYPAVFKSATSTSHYTFHIQPLSWTDAYNKCRREGPWSALISIDSKAEQDFIVNTIKKDKTLSLVGQNGFYTSGTDMDNEHQFTWTDTGKPRNVPTGFWHKDQPNNVGGGQDCLLRNIRLTTSNGEMLPVPTNIPSSVKLP